MTKKAVFLDRDGTINKEVDNLDDSNQLRLLSGVADAIKKLKKLGFLVVIVTNQPVVARGLLSEEEVDSIHELLIKRLRKKGANVDGIYYCPHHPEATLKEYRKKCKYRKPGAGMLLKAAKDFNIDLKRSFIVGDRTADILAGKRAGAKTILVNTGYGGEDKKYIVKPEFVANNLLEAVKVIKKNER